MSSPYGPPGGPPQWGQPQWGQQPQGPGMQPGPGYPPQQGGFVPAAAPPPQPPPPPQPVPPPVQQQPHGYGQQYPQQGGFGQFAEPPRKRRSALPWVLSGAGVLVVGAGTVLVLGFVTPGWFVKPVFDAASVEKGVSQTLKGSYGLTGVGEVTCPGSEPVQIAHRFDCQVTIDSQPRTVTVTVKNGRGVYEVGHPK